ncbi:porin [Salinicola halophilus]|uniref:porin n=1 Tax=Salinicola halophilus TaxID=184065 RepID=UPI0013A67A29|nr:porin [Salinicola halophilus]
MRRLCIARPISRWGRARADDVRAAPARPFGVVWGALRLTGSGLLAWALLSAALTSAAFGQTLGDERLTFSGFGTLAAVHSNQENTDFIRDISQREGAGEGWSGKTDTLLGAQLGYRFTDELDVVVQGLSRYQESGHFEPELSWAFVRYRPDPAVQLRAGRLGWDVYQLADSRYVGYAYNWVRPPVDHFGTLQLTHIDGADVTFTQPVGSDLVRLKLYAGRSDSEIYLTEGLSAEFDVDQVYGGNLDYETGPWRFRVSYTQVHSDVDFRGPVADQIDSIPFANLDANNVLGDVFGFDRITLFSLGALYDRGPVTVQAMVNRSKVTRHDGQIDSGFVSVGYRVERVTPYVMFSKVKTTSTNPDGSDIDQQTYSVGARYDIAANLALKAQFDRIDTQSPGFLWRDTDSDWNGGWSSIFSLGLDFIF